MYRKCETHGITNSKYCVECGKPTKLFEKKCPTCHRSFNYTFQKYCEKDGTLLVEVAK